MGIVVTNGTVLNNIRMTAGNIPAASSAVPGLILNMDAANYSGAGTNWPDSSGYGQNGTLQGNPVYNSTGKWFSFTSSLATQYVSFTNTSQIPTGSFSYTLITWASISSLKQNGFIGWGTYNSNFQVNAFRTSETNPGGLINYWWGNDLYRPISMTFNVWYQCVATYDKSTNTRTLYLNNTQVGTSDKPSVTQNATPATNLTLARTWTGVNEYLNGRLSVARIYNRAISTAEINSDFSSFRSRFPA